MKKAILTLCLIMAVVFFCGTDLARAAASYDLENGVDRLVRELLSNRSEIDRKWIAVTEFTSTHGDMGRLGKSLSEEISTRLRKQHKNLLSVGSLDTALKELRLNLTDLVDPKKAKKFGRFTGTDLLLLGNLTEFDQTILIQARLIDIETRIRVASARVELRKTKVVLNLMGIPYPGSLLVIGPSSSKVYLDGKLIGQTDWRGRLKVADLQPGHYTLTIQKEGYRSIIKRIEIREDEALRVETSHSKLPSPGTTAFLSFLVPGAGGLYLGEEGWYLSTLLVGASIYGAIYYNDKTEEMVFRDDGQGEVLEKRGKGPVYGFAALAVLFWALDIDSVYAKAKAKARRFQEEQVRLEIDPDKNRAMLVYTWNWP